MSDLLVQYGAAILMVAGMTAWLLGEGRRQARLEHIARSVAALEVRLAGPFVPPDPVDKPARTSPVRKAILTMGGVTCRCVTSWRTVCPFLQG